MVLEFGLSIRGLVTTCYSYENVDLGFYHQCHFLRCCNYFLFSQTCLAIQDLAVAHIFIYWCSSTCI